MLTWQAHAKLVGILASVMFSVGLFLLFLTFAQVNAINATLAGEAQPTMDMFMSHTWVQLSLAIIALGAVLAIFSIGLGLFGAASDLTGDGYLRQLRRDAKATLVEDDVAATPLRVALKMLELETAEKGWQIETIHAYLDVAKRDETPIDGDLLTQIATYCRQAHAHADQELEKGRQEPMTVFAGRKWHASELVTQTEKIAERIRELRHRDSRPTY